MFICVIRIYQQHIRRIMVHIFLRKRLQPIWLQSTFNNTNRYPSQCRASGMEFLCLAKGIPMSAMQQYHQVFVLQNENEEGLPTEHISWHYHLQTSTFIGQPEVNCLFNFKCYIHCNDQTIR